MSNGNGNVRDYEADCLRLTRDARIMQDGIRRVNEENIQLQKDLNLQLRINLSLEGQVLQLKTINQNAMTEGNETRQTNAAEIERLRNLVKECGGNPN